VFLCNVSFCYNRKQDAWVLTVGRGQTKSTFFILAIHTFADVELSEIDFLLKNCWQVTNTLLKNSNEDYFYQTHCFLAGSSSY